MKTYQNICNDDGWKTPLETKRNAQLVLTFGNRSLAQCSIIQRELDAHFPNAHIIGCTTSGEILGDDLYDDTLCLTALELESSKVQVFHSHILNDEPLTETAKELAQKLPIDDLKYVLVLSDGQQVNGTQLVEGLASQLPNDIVITGGLAGDGTQFSETIVWCDGEAESGKIVVCGFYGESLQVSHGSMGGWDPFGPQRIITDSDQNILKSLDGKPALQIYKQYLGEYSQDLPSSALLFPLMIDLDTGHSVIRTILNIDEENETMIFAGDIPKGATAQMMRANFDRLIDGAEDAAAATLNRVSSQDFDDGLVLMISCVGRRLVLKQRTEEELEAVKDLLGEKLSYTGFYSYGEISPVVDIDCCALHNQTMTITTLYEKNV